MATCSVARGLNPDALEYYSIRQPSPCPNLPSSFPYETQDLNHRSEALQPPFPAAPHSPLYFNITPVFPHVLPSEAITLQPPPCGGPFGPSTEIYVVWGYRGSKLLDGQVVNIPDSGNGGAAKKKLKSRYRAKRASSVHTGDGFAAVGAGTQAPKLHWRVKDRNLDGEDDRRQYYVRALSGRQKTVPTRASNKPKQRLMPLTPDGGETTVMIRNIPNQYSREMLKEFLLKHCKSENQEGNEEVKGSSVTVSAFDFLYLPIDFGSGCNQGYAFVNFTTPEAAWKFCLASNYQKWDRFNSSKVRDIRRARIQGKEALVRNFEWVEFPLEGYQPQCYEPAHDGSEGQVVKESSIGICAKHALKKLT
ncbi:hypothetical protein SLE2022_200810 [Rubroshorea leprosula]